MHAWAWHAFPGRSKANRFWTPFVLGFEQEPFGAVGEQGTGVRPSLQFPIETLQFLRKTTLRLLLTY